MPICPQCHATFELLATKCPNDGYYAIPEDAITTRKINPLLGTAINNQYAILRKIGQGGMGTVYEAYQFALNRTIAIKILAQNLQKYKTFYHRFKNEAESAAKLNHPNIVTLYDTGLDPITNNAYIAMELVDGIQLSELDQSIITPSNIVHIVSQILSALQEAHKNNIVHRDLKPDNIMISKQENDPLHIKILDFGLAYLITKNISDSNPKETLGTPWYMSPEQALAMPATAASDIYSLGCVLYELISSKPPFPGNRPLNVLMQQANAPVPPLMPRHNITPSNELINFTLKCLEKTPEDRFSSALDALEHLQKLPEWHQAALNNSETSLKIALKKLIQESQPFLKPQPLHAFTNNTPNPLKKSIDKPLTSMPKIKWHKKCLHALESPWLGIPLLLLLLSGIVIMLIIFLG